MAKGGRPPGRSSRPGAGKFSRPPQPPSYPKVPAKSGEGCAVLILGGLGTLGLLGAAVADAVGGWWS